MVTNLKVGEEQVLKKSLTIGMEKVTGRAASGRFVSLCLMALLSIDPQNILFAEAVKREALFYDDFFSAHLSAQQSLALAEDTSQVFWQNKSHKLYFLNETSQNVLSTYLKHHSSYMVSFAHGSNFERQLQSDPDTKIFIPASSTTPGFALLTIGEDQAKLDSIATQAHSLDAGGGLACGRLEKLTGMPNLTAGEPAAIIYRASVPLKNVSQLFQYPDQNKILQSIETFVNLGTRGHTSEQGKKTPDAIATYAKELVGSKLPKLQIQKHAFISSSQNNLIITLPGEEDDETRIIVGAHMDTINQGSTVNSAPGADDDASGMATELEVLRIIAEQNLRFKRRVEFHFYGAEEKGLLGSSALATEYKFNEVNVGAMLQLDMNSYSHVENGKTIYLITTDTSESLNQGMKNLLLTYLGGDLEELELPQGTSDHRSWANHGYPTTFPFEHPTLFNKALHTSNDTTDTAHNFALTQRFVKLVLAYLSHYGGLESAADEYQSILSNSSKDLSAHMWLAITPKAGSSESKWNIAVATDLATTKVVICSTSDSRHCTSALNTFAHSKNINARSFYLNADDHSFSLYNGQSLVIYGYDSADHLLQRRVVTLTKKS